MCLDVIAEGPPVFSFLVISSGSQRVNYQTSSCLAGSMSAEFPLMPMP